MNKTILTTLIILFIVVIGGIVLYKVSIQRMMTEKKVMAHVEKEGYTEQIKSKKTMYDSKQGGYFVEIVYKDEPNNRYEYYVSKHKSPNNPVYVIGYNKDNVEIQDKEEGEYIDKDW